MAIKGAQAKAIVTKEILDFFGDRAFQYDKEIRVNCVENGEPCQIKITLTAAKVMVEGGDAVTTTVQQPTAASTVNAFDLPEASIPVAEPTQEEKDNVKTLLERLGL